MQHDVSRSVLVRGWTGERGKAASEVELLMRMAGQVWFPPANQMGEGCQSPEKYPAQPKGGMSHGPKQDRGTSNGWRYCKRKTRKWAQAKARAKAKMGGKHSARAMQLATKYYKDSGGKYEGKKPSAKTNKMKSGPKRLGH